ncbi:MAG: hypothetical protein K9W43_13285 [Candidatus Thorarchaeota archaeon]|nr:hypothetical protein [Candidatus Thorarchaeota archaeon]
MDDVDRPPYHFEEKLYNEYLAEIKYILPIYIPIPDGAYDVHLKDAKAEVTIKRVNKITQVSKMIEAAENTIKWSPYLRYDPFSSSFVTVRFRPSRNVLKALESADMQAKDPFTEGTIDPCLEESLKFINKILRVYQYITGDVGNGQVQPWDVGMFDLIVGPYPKSPPGTAISYKQIGFARPLTFTSGSPTSLEKVSAIKDRLESSWDVPFIISCFILHDTYIWLAVMLLL